jgi:hypothetical protein
MFRHNRAMRVRFVALATAASLVLAPLAFDHASAALGDCGQPVSAGNASTASDALFILQAAVGSQSCEPCVCDVDGAPSATITASDALRVLRRAVGQPLVLVCPDCPAGECDASSPPECGGACGAGLTCAPHPIQTDACVCLNECELSSQPVCGGSCDAATPAGLECTPIRFTQGETVSDVCMCLPAEFTVCVDVAAPGCNGVCRPGARCVADAGACVCDALPAQAACGDAATPACAGICGPDLICVAQGEACACVDAEDREENCTQAQAPSCGGTCASGRLCAATGTGACECFDACALSQAPACSGACSEGRQCGARTVNVGGSDLELCECR